MEYETKLMADGKPLKISWSSLKKFENCSAHEALSRAGKAQPRVDGRIFLPGTIADRVMRLWLLQENPQPGQMVGMVDEVFRQYADPETDAERDEAQYTIKWRGNQAKDREAVKEFVRQVVTELEPILTHWVLPYDYSPELRFKTTIGIPYLDGKITGIVLSGGIDIATRYEPPSEKFPAGQFRLFDLKATKSDEYIRTTLGQATFYHVAWGAYIGDRSQPDQDFGFIAPALPNKIHWAAITEDDRHAMMGRIIRFAHSRWRDEWTPKADDKGCNQCDTKHVCPKFALKIDKDAIGRHRVSFGEQSLRRRTYRETKEAKDGEDLG